MSWRDYLRADELGRLAELAKERARNKSEYRRIYDRCRKRMEKDSYPRASGGSNRTIEPRANKAAQRESGENA